MDAAGKGVTPKFKLDSALYTQTEKGVTPKFNVYSDLQTLLN